MLIVGIADENVEVREFAIEKLTSAKNSAKDEYKNILQNLKQMLCQQKKFMVMI